MADDRLSRYGRHLPILRDAWVEFVFTTVFLFVTTSTVASTCNAAEQSGPGGCLLTVPRILTVALTFGASIAVLVYAAAPYSGGHLNPAVTLAFLASRQIGPVRAALYWTGQLAGATFGSLLAKGVNKAGYDGVSGAANKIAPGYTWLHIWLLELLLTFLLVITVLVATDKQRGKETAHVPVLAPFAIGLAVLLAHFVAIPLDGCSINPARSFGPAVVAHQWRHQYVFWLGPASGALLAVALYVLTLRSKAVVTGAADPDRNIVRLPTFAGTAGLQETPAGRAAASAPTAASGV